MRVFAGADRHGEQPLGRIVHQGDFSLLIGHDDRIGDRVDHQVQTIALGTYLRLGRSQLRVVLVDLPRRLPQVRDVPENRDDTRAFPRVDHDRAEQLEQQVGSLRGIDEEQLAAAGFALAERRA